MHLSPLLRVLPVALLLVGLGFVPAQADEGGQARPAPSHAYVDMNGALSPQGDVTMKLSLRPAPERWKLLKERYNTPARLLRDIMPHHSAMETRFSNTLEFDERNLRIHTHMQILGYARNEGDGEWFVDLDLDAGMKVTGFIKDEEEGQTNLIWSIAQASEELVIEMGVGLSLPKGAQRVRVNEGLGQFRYHLPRPDGEGRPRLDMGLRVKPRILSGAYKVYAMADAAPEQWLARAVMTNTGTSVVRRLRVRFRMPGYAEWGLWTKFPEVVPGQTVVVPYHPVLDAKIAQLQSKTQVNVMVEWRYEDVAGEKHEDSDGARATLLGGKEFYFSNYRPGEIAQGGDFYEIMTENGDMLAAWVSREDAVVDQFAAMANRIAGGSATHKSPNHTVTSLHGIYELWVRNKFVYVSPAGVVDTSKSFDPKLLQNIKYPRDVIRDKAGTCIDLAILYASMAQSLGIECYLALVPGHCFPVFRLPSTKRGQKGDFFPIEATGIQGGTGNRRLSFEDAVKYGMQQLGMVFQGKMPGYLVPLNELWEKGMTGPELPELPADIIQRWGLSEGSGEILTNRGTGGGTERQAATSPVGTYVGKQVFVGPNGSLPWDVKLVIGKNQNGQLVFEAAGSARIQTPNGFQRLRSAAVGTVAVQGNKIQFNIVEGAVRNLETGYTEPEQPSSIVLGIQNGVIAGQIQGNGMVIRYQLRKQ